ncbi:DnaJ domain [Trypanosoma vivax]|uniref:Putative chaperone protein DNAj n=1 Tax=Trypanosoma vivax (strain Y486) TaxID=1055687 RepID=G0TUS1_TRYVY|nr:putative chaperone protein DNAj [Trypanosoma vivax]KAH8617712.1 DnaJ domain [Trypanosoma vivax]CCC47707.1 putative chaperone protein DNAj [Trypanosoma vivax Y486]
MAERHVDAESGISTKLEEKSGHVPLEGNSIFIDRVPKHVLQGLGDAVVNVTTGIGLGLGAAVAHPIAGALEGGPVGAAKGAGIGLLKLVGATVCGAATGASQIVRGLANTVEAVKESARGERFWCSLTGGWEEIRLDAELKELPLCDEDIYEAAHVAYLAHIKMANSVREGVVGDSGNRMSLNGDEGGYRPDYYAILGVEHAATGAEIRAAFHRKVLELHPDKNPANVEATRRFQEVVEANNILSNETSRAMYDNCTQGTVTTTGAHTPIEESLGAVFLDVFIGRVEWAIHLIPNTMFTSEMKRNLQLRRVYRLAQNLLRFVDDDGALEGARATVVDAVSTRRGVKLMTFVAEEYFVAARQHLTKNTLLREMDRFGTGKWTSVRHVVGVAAKAIPAAYKIAKKTLDEDDVLDAVVAICESDVRNTVLRASRLILFDLSVPAEQRQLRAERLIRFSNLIGEVIKDVGPVER